ncbi:MAG: DUF1266 domain-containing protein [Janthinobacterium lividum]
MDSILVDAEQRLAATKLCNQAWGIETARELAEGLNSLASGGHRVPFRYRIRQYSLMRRPAIAARREEFREAGLENSSALNELWRLDAVQADWHGIRGGNLLAFDAARAVMLVRCGLVLGWLGHDDAWRYLTDMAADVQRNFTSWVDFATDYMLASAVWTGDDRHDQTDDTVAQLLEDASSPWRRLPWRIGGLEVPRPVAQAVVGAPVWSLER